MPRIKPFKALRPAEGSAARVASVPYDVVSRDEALALAAGNDDSFLHVIRPDIDLPANADAYGDGIYEKALENLSAFRDRGTLVQDPAPALFLYQQTMDGKSQCGVVACCHLDDYENNLILKHEFTRPVKENDRTRHLLTLRANTGPVFLTYRNDGSIDSLVDTAKASQPLEDFVSSDGVAHTIWKIDQTDAMVTAFEQVPQFYIADGHHRAASALRARQELKQNTSDHTGDEGYNWFLTVLFPSDQLNILPYNRIVADTNGLTETELFEQLSVAGKVRSTDSKSPQSAGCIHFYYGGSWYELEFKSEIDQSPSVVKQLDVAMLETRILAPIFGIGDVRTDPRIDFVGGIRGPEELEKQVDSGDWAIAFSMYPTSIDQLMAVSDAGQVMPPKSTWFEPKLRSGLFTHLLD
jgi:uncharacterized protein (DUF1015 family)